MLTSHFGVHKSEVDPPLEVEVSRQSWGQFSHTNHRIRKINLGMTHKLNVKHERLILWWFRCSWYSCHKSGCGLRLKAFYLIGHNIDLNSRNGRVNWYHSTHHSKRKLSVFSLDCCYCFLLKIRKYVKKCISFNALV